ncbi:MAG: type II 3-dehydroquinate dehydratase [Casimicrobiaceae bacterium]
MRPRTATASKRRSQATASRLLVIHGPNLNLLGTREPGIYGLDTLVAINARLVALATARGATLATFQSNHEGAIVDRIHVARDEHVAFIVINPAGFTHTSVAIRDALSGVAIPFVEVHLSNVHAREAFRHHSHFSDKAVGTIAGLGARGYEFAVDFAIDRLER